MRSRTPFDHATALAAVVTAALMLGAPFAAAQSGRDCAAIESNAERLACYDCAAVAADAERLACYDRALRAGSPQPILRAPEREPRPAVAPAPAQPAPPPGPRVGERSDEQDDTRQPVPIVVVGLRTLQGKATFTTDGGDVWVQTDGRSARLPDPPFRAEIRPGSLSSYFLVPADARRAIRVRRAN